MAGQQRVTINEVARSAGVSRQTVSNVLRGTGRVGADTAQRVRKIVDDLGYVVHPGARSLRSLRTGQLAYPLDEWAMDPRDVLGLGFIRDLTLAAGVHGYHVLLMAPGLDAIRDLIRSARVDGFVFTNLRHNDPRVDLMAEYDACFACMGRTGPAQRQAWVDIDNRDSIRLVTTHLAERGHRSMVFLGYRPLAYWDTERAEGYRATMETLGLEPRTVLVKHDDVPIARAAAAVLDTAPRPTAVVCGSDELAAAVYAAASSRGLTVGRDLAVTGFGNDAVGRGLSPSLTTVPIPTRRIAELVMARFARELGGEPDTPGELIAPELLIGASSGP